MKNKGQAWICLWNRVMNKYGFASGQRIRITSTPSAILVVSDESGKRKVSRVANHGNILAVIDLKQTKQLDLTHLGRIGDSVVVTFEQDLITISSANTEINSVFVDPAEDEGSYENSTEGRQNKVLGIEYERKNKYRDQCLEHWGYSCQVCGLNFEDRYGSIGKDFIHVHHLNPLALTGETVPDPVNDLRPVCPNCHSMLHKQSPPFSLEDLEERIQE